MVGTNINVDDWDVLKKSALSILPDMVSVGRLDPDHPDYISAKQIADLSQSTKYEVSPTLARNGLFMRPMKYENANKVRLAFNAASKKMNANHRVVEEARILVFVFTTKCFKELFSEDAIKKYQLDFYPVSSFQERTISNFLACGRVTEYTIAELLKHYQKCYTEQFRGQKVIPEIVKSFINCSDLREYATTNYGITHKAIRKDDGDEFMLSKQDLKFMTKDWWDGR